MERAAGPITVDPERAAPLRRRLLSAYVGWVTEHPRAVIGVVIGVTVLLCVRTVGLKIEVNPDSQLPQTHPYIRALNHLNEVFGEKNLFFIGLFPRDGTIYTPPFLAKLKLVTDRIGALPGIVARSYMSLAVPKAVDIRGDDDGDDDGMEVRPLLDPLPRTREQAAALRARLAANPQYLGTIVAHDGSAAAIIADFDFTPPLSGYPEALGAIEGVLREADDGTYTAHVGGPANYVAWLTRYSARMFFFLPLAVLVIGLAHYEAFRTVQAIVLPLVTALLAMLWSLGILALLDVSLDPFNVTTPILILAVAAGHAVQMLKRFYEELAVTHDPRPAVLRSMSKIGPVMIVATTIAALSFLSLLTFETTTIRNFGLLTAFGILSALAIEMTLIPAVRSLLPPPREGSPSAVRHLSAPVIDRLGPFLRAGGWRTIIRASAAIAVLCAVASMRLNVDSSFQKQFSPGSAVRLDDRALNEAFGGTNTLVLLIDGRLPGAIDEPKLLRAIDELQRWFEVQPGVGKTLSFVDFVKRMHRAASGAPEGTLPDRRNLVAQYMLLYSMGGSVEDFDSLVDPTHRVCALRVFLKEDGTRFAQGMIARLEDRLPEVMPSGYGVEVTGSLASSVAMNQTMVKGKLANIVQVGLIVLLIASVALRSLVGGFLVAMPLALAVATNFGVMGALGIPLDIGSATISAMAVGIGADYAVYFLFRLREEIDAGKPLVDAVERALDTSGRAILFVSTAIAAGYLTLCCSGFGYHVKLGTLVALAMAVSSLASITLLPSLVLAIRPQFLTGRVRPWRSERGASSRRAPLPAGREGFFDA